MIVNEEHYIEFDQRALPSSGWKGSIPSAWVRALPDYAGGSLPDDHVPKPDLRAFCQFVANTHEACFVAVMAWGGMRRSSARSAWNERHRWLPIVEELRGGGISRTGAYKRFHNARVPGLAPAYFTKLIHFLRPERDGYILDQWTAKSVSLLFGHGIISITREGWVDRTNDATVYGRYCEAVERLAEKRGITSEAAEEMMFSRGGKAKQPWRQYVVQNWPMRRQ